MDVDTSLVHNERKLFSSSKFNLVNRSQEIVIAGRVPWDGCRKCSSKHAPASEMDDRCGKTGLGGTEKFSDWRITKKCFEIRLKDKSKCAGGSRKLYPICHGTVRYQMKTTNPRRLQVGMQECGRRLNEAGDENQQINLVHPDKCHRFLLNSLSATLCFNSLHSQQFCIPILTEMKMNYQRLTKL